jgi:DNA-binding Lrp family transcriptional regulator
MDNLDQRLLDLLSQNSRLSVTELSKRLKVTRATVQEHMRRLERNHIVQGYTIRLHPEHEKRQVSADVLISVDQKKLASVSRQLEQLSSVRALYSISGQFDLSANVQEETTQALDEAIDRMVLIDGVQRTQTSIILSKKFER